MSQFISLTDTNEEERNINVSYIIEFYKSSEIFSGNSIVKLTDSSIQVEETVDEIDDKIDASILKYFHQSKKLTGE